MKKHLYRLCECGLPWQLCCVVCSIELMCQAAFRGEVYIAQLNADMIWDVLQGVEL